MAITATLAEKTAVGENVTVIVFVTDDAAEPGTGTTRYELTLPAAQATVANFRRLLQARRAGGTAAGAVLPTLPDVGQSWDLTALPDPTPDPAVVARDTWLRDYRRLQGGLALAAAGIVLDTDPLITTTRTTLSTAFAALTAGQKADYVDHL